MSRSKPTGETFVVVGGSGFLGQSIVAALQKRGEANVTIADVRPPPADSPYASALEKATFQHADLTDAPALVQLIAKLQPQVVIHTASPMHGLGKHVYEKVNVQGTANLIDACRKARVAKLVFTSSAGVVFDGNDLVNVDERLPFPETPMDAYNDTKARAEQLVLLANDDAEGGLKTCALRPAGIFGPGDRQALPGFFEVYKTGRAKFQIGDNLNLFDWTYVDNVAHAHLLASDALLKPVGATAETLATEHLPSRCLGEEERQRAEVTRGVPTSEQRQSTPGGVPDYAAQLPSTLTSLRESGAIDLRPVVRNKFDQFFHLVNPDAECVGNPLPRVSNLSTHEGGVKVAGEAFFITNGQPIPFWDFPRALWREYDPENGHVDASNAWRIPRSLGMVLASCSEAVGLVTGRTPSFTRFRVTFTASKRFYNIEKARRALGYEPLVGLEEGIRRSVQWWKEQEAAGAIKKE